MMNGKATVRSSSNTKQRGARGVKTSERTEKKRVGSVSRAGYTPVSARRVTAPVHVKSARKRNTSKSDGGRVVKVGSVNEQLARCVEPAPQPSQYVPATSYRVKVPVHEDLEGKEGVATLSIVNKPHVNRILPQFSSKNVGLGCSGRRNTGILDKVDFTCKVSSGHGGRAGAVGGGKEFKGDDDDEEEEEEFKGDDDDDDDEEDDSDDDDEEDDSDDDDEDDSDDDDDDDDDSVAVTREGYEKEKITVKISREGDRNVKIIYITRSTTFMAFARTVKRRFGYSRLADFDIYSIDVAGDYVDIDVAQDFKSLVRHFLQKLKQERSCNTSVNAALNKKSAGQGRRFSARGTLLRSASLLRTSCCSNDAGSSFFEGDCSGDMVLRLYVRDSYKTRQQEEKRGLNKTISQGEQSKIHATPQGTPLFLTADTSVIGDILSEFGKDKYDFLSAVGNTLSLPPTYESRSLGTTIGFCDDEEMQWSKIGLLGKGSFGSVYEGVTSGGKIMAVKVLDIPLNESVDDLDGVRREINLMKSLKHPNIVAYYGCQTRTLPNGGQQLEIFLEHCHGGSLSHLRRKFERAKERFSISLVRTYTKQILEGLSYLHSMNVVHRDLKGDNVLISASGEVKLADFGCSKRLGTATINLTGGAKMGAGYQTMIGSPIFMAPEVLSCEGSYTKAADVWSVGCLVLEMLGRQPWTFKSDTNAFQMMYHISRSTTMPTGVPKECPASLLNFFKRCFERDIKTRATAGELLAHEWVTCPDNRLQELLN